MLIPGTSTEYLHIAIAAPAGTDLTGSPVKIAIVAHMNTPSDAEWHTAEWADDAARILIGPDGGALTLDPGDYRVWVTFDPPGAENIVRRSGHLGIA